MNQTSLSQSTFSLGIFFSQNMIVMGWAYFIASGGAPKAFGCPFI
jgi:hypothetical protein